MIYDFSLSYDGVQKRIDSKELAWLKLTKSDGQKTPNLKTPGLLLVSQQVSSEAFACLRKKQLVISCPPRLCLYRNDALSPWMVLTRAISSRTLRNNLRLKLDMPSPETLVDACPCNGKIAASISFRLWFDLIIGLSERLVGDDNKPRVEELSFRHGQVEHSIKRQYIVDFSDDVQMIVENLFMRHEYENVVDAFKDILQAAKLFHEMGEQQRKDASSAPS